VAGGLVLAREAFVFATATRVVIVLPAVGAVVLQTELVATEELRFVRTIEASRLLQVGIDLNGLFELGTGVMHVQIGSNAHVHGTDGAHVAGALTERDTAGPDGILVLVRVNASV